MSGVINGIDYTYFAPEDDNAIYEKYSTSTLSEGKKIKKKAFCKEL